MSTKVAAMTITNVFDIDKKVIQDDARAIISTFKFIEKVDTSTWKTYRNEEFGFEFRYPGNWVYQELGGKSFGGFVNFYSSGKIPSSQNMVIPDIALSLFPNPKNLDLKSFYLNQSSNWFYASDSQIPFKTTNGLDGEKFIAIYGAGLDDIISIKKDLIVIELQDFNQQHANDGILDMIINSIK
ncbi:hypothetical protein A2872_00160 [Candidatus Gottesmanbacteria bacterium RIFCSPHIGHO2_01_FULL_42_12]|uniref:Uncharacterized protein n=1 Tax=Candidatus Gottesmanbacteria bacterium RIFCSPHIGHO2_01_FULL_42_12 TaxID=1798377 RepID=A0A1F5Z3Y9_9BACT|nr:MAG: hypothetical protein A2872_00160 [Candidatus Gottesmanbacteria bacterium RIFCSPHIGHO2_01_FULL_42_12]